MVEARLSLEPEVQKVFKNIDEGNNFLLSGGAGSGKTYSLVKVINQIFIESPNVAIACITYTNAAVNEIESRVQHKKLSVSTIHDFLWDNIKNFQVELKEVLINLINDDSNNGFMISNEEVERNYFRDEEIQYKESRILKKGIISHDDLLTVANKMFRAYPKLCNIVKSKFQFIFIDEYQDTDKQVIEIFLEYLLQGKRKSIVGLFGDSMQSIYDSGIGDVSDYILNKKIKEVQKKQNRRNPQLVMDLANKLRTDGIIQEPSLDVDAPNMINGVVKKGKVSFYYTSGENKLNELKETLGWDFTASKEVKELILTHNLIAPRAGFPKLMEIYDGDKIIDYKLRIINYVRKNNITDDFLGHTFGEVVEKLKKTAVTASQVEPTVTMQTYIDNNKDLFNEAKNLLYEDFKRVYIDKDMLLDGKKENSDDPSKQNSKRDSMIAHLFKIQNNINLYEQGKYNEFLRKTEFKIKSVADKRKIQEIILQLKTMTNKTIKEVIDFAHENRICVKDDNLRIFKEKNRYVYNRVKRVSFQEFQNLYAFLEGYTPFTTQHKIKGEEFNNVLVILDNGNWNKYNFEYLLDEQILDMLNSSKQKSYPGILNRTRKLFYVCCTRAKEELVVYYHNPSEGIINKASEWFGKSNVHPID